MWKAKDQKSKNTNKQPIVQQFQQQMQQTQQMFATLEQAQAAVNSLKSAARKDEAAKLYHKADIEALKLYQENDSRAMQDLQMEIDTANKEQQGIINQLKEKCKIKRAAARSVYIRLEAEARDVYHRSIE